MTPEDLARVQIDQLLQNAGWEVQDRARMSLFGRPRRGVALREAAMTTGEADYLLLVDGKAVGVIEAKRVGHTLSQVEEQSGRYAVGMPAGIQAWLPGRPLPFRYESTGVETFFTNGLDPEPRSRRVFAFHAPATLAAWADEPQSLRGRLRAMPGLITEHLWPPQVRAITGLERSLAEDRPRALIQMATGSGKTFTAVNAVYRLIRHAGARHVLFLVDRNNLGLQAYKEFDNFITPDDGRKFGELYNIRHLTHRHINPKDEVNRVTICTIQRLYALLRDEELDEEADFASVYELEERGLLESRQRTVSFTGRLPIEHFDFIIVDECHRSIYTVWRQVLEYFDAYLIGLTATPGKQTIGFFRQNMVSEYTHEMAVADKINVAGEVYRIRTRIGDEGSTVEAGFYVDKLDKLTRERRAELLDEELTYSANQLDRDVASESQIRTVIRCFRDALFTEMYPERTGEVVPKTLIFAKDDNHAETIVRIAREEFGKGNDFCQKITYRAHRNPENILTDFRNGYHPRIAVTVDMIATGTDVRPIEVLLFMRQVRSRGYYEQMRGRATRVIGSDELQSVTSDTRHKTHFVLVDAVGLDEAGMFDTTPPLERKRSVPFKQLLEEIAFGADDADTVSSLAGRLARLQHQLTPGDEARVRETADGRALSDLIGLLFDALDPDRQMAQATWNVVGAGLKPAPTEEDIAAAAAELRQVAIAPFRDSPDLRAALITTQARNEIIIDITSTDTVTQAGFDAAETDRLRGTIEAFRRFIEDNKDEIAALRILYDEPYGQSRPTFVQLKELAEALQRPPYSWTETALWNAYAKLERDRVRGATAPRVLTDLVALVRHALQPDGELRPYPEQVRARYEKWLAAGERAGKQFTPEQRWWLDKITETIGLNLSVEPEDFDNDGAFIDRGGRWGAAEALGPAWRDVLAEMNRELVV
jgi:type I restriction enzyme R subunit